MFSNYGPQKIVFLIPRQHPFIMLKTRGITFTNFCRLEITKEPLYEVQSKVEKIKDSVVLAQ